MFCQALDKTLLDGWACELSFRYLTLSVNLLQWFRDSNGEYTDGDNVGQFRRLNHTFPAFGPETCHADC